MTNYLAIEWGPKQLSCVEARVADGAVEVTRLFTLVWPEDVQPKTDIAAAANWLKQQLRQQGVSATKVLLALEREQVVVRHLEVPNVPPDELPDVVRFQASTKSALPLDQLGLDFLPLPRREHDEGQQVLVATLPRKTIGIYQDLFGQADMELVSVGVSSMALVELINRQAGAADAPPKGIDVTLALHEEWVEITAFSQGMMLLSHATQVHPDQMVSLNSAVLMELNRTVVALQKVIEMPTLNRVWLIAEPDAREELARQLSHRYDVLPLEMWATKGVRRRPGIAEEFSEHYVGPLGMLLAQSEPTGPGIDFINPRKPPIRRDYRKWRIAGIVAAVLLSVVGFYLYRRAVIVGLDEQITSVQQQSADLKKQLEELKPKLTSHETLTTWRDHRIEWLKHLQTLAAMMESTDEYYLTELRCEQSVGTGLGSLSAQGHAKFRESVEALYVRIFENGLYEIRAHDIPRGSVDAEYPYDFNVDLQITPGMQTAQAGSSERSAGGTK